MTIDELLAPLLRASTTVPRAALAAAGERRDEVTPHLLAAIAEAVAHPERLEQDRDYQLPFYAMYLLAAWREPRAHPLLVGFLRLPGDLCVDLSGDIVTQDMHHMLAQTCGGDATSILALAADPKVNEWARGAAGSALAYLTAWGGRSKEALVSDYHLLIEAALQRDQPGLDGTLLADIVCHALNLQLTELRQPLATAFGRGLVDEDMVSETEFVEELGHRSPVGLRPPITDVAKAIAWWRCFERPHRRAPQPIAPPVGDATPPSRSAPPAAQPSPAVHVVSSGQTYHAPQKVGRNDPCPCGSGKKFKKCCGA